MNIAASPPDFASRFRKLPFDEENLDKWVVQIQREADGAIDGVADRLKLSPKKREALANELYDLLGVLEDGGTVKKVSASCREALKRVMEETTPVIGPATHIVRGLCGKDSKAKVELGVGTAGFVRETVMALYASYKKYGGMPALDLDPKVESQIFGVPMEQLKGDGTVGTYMDLRLAAMERYYKNGNIIDPRDADARRVYLPGLKEEAQEPKSGQAKGGALGFHLLQRDFECSGKDLLSEEGAKDYAVRFFGKREAQ